MTDPAAKASDTPALEMRLSVPSEGDLSAIAAELAVKVTEFLGGQSASISATLDALSSRVAASGEEITFEFREVDRELVIEARCNGRTSEVRHPLSA
jgi:hypothetical protein